VFSIVASVRPYSALIGQLCVQYSGICQTVLGSHWSALC